MATYTPGPWSVWSIDGASIVDATGTRVATASGGADHRDANARLIAAAPELLEALELFANLDRTVNSDLWAIDAMYCERARAAIQKARA